MKGVWVVMPVLNEADNIASVIEKLDRVGLKKVAVGVDLRTTDNTEQVLKKLEVNCQRGLVTGYDGSMAAGVKQLGKDCEWVLFCDAGGKYEFDIVRQMYQLAIDGADMVLAVRKGGGMLWHQRLGTALVLGLINLQFGTGISDISPLRLVRKKLLDEMQMETKKFSYPSQMLVKALAMRAVIKQVEVETKMRTGKSKISGSLKNSLKAGWEMLGALKYAGFRNHY